MFTSGLLQINKRSVDRFSTSSQAAVNLLVEQSVFDPSLTYKPRMALNSLFVLMCR